MQTDTPPQAPDTPAVAHPKFVRVLNRHPNGLVVFEFAVGWPDLAAELVMPQEMFDAFCARHQVAFLDGPADPQLGDSRDDD